VVAGVLRAGGGAVRVPDGPGLGIAVDPAPLEAQTAAVL
jgi:L-alanine-DL-glutamate epimerase-like enolase superfamily enzyme